MFFTNRKPVIVLRFILAVLIAGFIFVFFHKFPGEIMRSALYRLLDNGVYVPDDPTTYKLGLLIGTVIAFCGALSCSIAFSMMAHGSSLRKLTTYAALIFGIFRLLLYFFVLSINDREDVLKVHTMTLTGHLAGFLFAILAGSFIDFYRRKKNTSPMVLDDNVSNAG